MTTTTTTTTGVPSSMRTITTVRRTSAPRVLLAVRAHIDLHDKGLASLTGAREVISAIRARKTVTKLFLGNNALGDDGCRELFRFLCTEDGRRYRIAVISLNSNNIGNVGLEAIAEYLEGNEYLRELFLQNNAFEGEVESAIRLSTSINASKLELLSLASNLLLADAFFIPFIAHLDSSSLRELQISAIGLTRVSASALTAYCASHRSRTLEVLKCSGNTLGTRAVRSLLSTLRKTNFTLQKLEIYANADFRGRDPDEEVDEGEEEESLEEARAKWTFCEQELKNMLVRNELLRRIVHEEALVLLTYARALLLDSSRSRHTRREPSSSPSPSKPNSALPFVSVSYPSTESKSPTPISTSASTSPFPFRALPAELQQYILSHLAPSLSPAQHTRVFSFASDPATLRPLLPTLSSTSPHAGCIPDPASLPFSSMSTSPGSPESMILGVGSPNNSGSKVSKTSPASLDMGMGMGMGKGLMEFAHRPAPSRTTCAGGKCMGAGGSVLCHRAEVRMRWLADVECARFDADGRGEADVIWLLASNT